jgi:hypothetical protein
MFLTPRYGENRGGLGPKKCPGPRFFWSSVRAPKLPRTGVTWEVDPGSAGSTLTLGSMLMLELDAEHRCDRSAMLSVDPGIEDGDTLARTRRRMA